MPGHLHRDVEQLKREIISVGSLVEEAIDKAILALTERRPELAEEVISGDAQVDAREVQIEEECLKILALHQPVATDLRFVVTALKVNNDLERMGDLAVNVAERASYLSRHDVIGGGLGFGSMTRRVREMVHGSIECLVDLDAERARVVIGQDDAVDAANARMHEVLQERMRADVTIVDRAVHLISISKQLERISDLATNIAEDVVFLVEGEVVRHQSG